METKNVEKDKIIDLAKKAKHYCDLLIKQSDNWLSEEEGIKNVEKRISDEACKKRKNTDRILSVGWSSPCDIPAALRGKCHRGENKRHRGSCGYI